jgi:endonuclease/exonuclease/phosphatase family metal-dependent hydrolase
MKLKVATWNIGGGLIKSASGKFDEENLDYFTNTIKDLDCDVVFLQEVHGDEMHSQATELADRLGYSCATQMISKSHLEKNKKFHLSIIAKQKLSNPKLIKLTNPKLENKEKGYLSHDKGFILCELEIENKSITLVSGHLFPYYIFGKRIEDDELSYAREEIDLILSSLDDPRIIGVDMNSENSGIILPKSLSSSLVEVENTQATCPSGEHVDHIFTSKDIKASETKVIEGEADHFILISTLEVA